jgi:hypothetical protein
MMAAANHGGGPGLRADVLDRHAREAPPVRMHLPDPQTRRWSPRSWPPALRELAVFACAYLTYFGVRALTEGGIPAAMQNAAEVMRIERWLGLDWEASLQTYVLGHPLLVDAMNAVYVYGHWPVLIVGGVLLFRYRRPHYYRLRNAIVLTGCIGLVVFALFPVAPPRLSDLGIVDTVTRELGGYRQILPRSLVNEYAAMPSFHAGWNLLLGIVVFGATRNPLLRLLALAGPAAMCVAVIATANHFVVDVVVGVTIVLVSLAVLDAVERRRGSPTLEVVDAGGAVRRGAPGRERSPDPRMRTPSGLAADRGRRAPVRLPPGGASSQDDRPDPDPVGPVGACTPVDAEAVAGPCPDRGGQR